MDINTITPTSGIDLLVHRGIERIREKATSPTSPSEPGAGGFASPLSEFFPASRRWSKGRSGDYSQYHVAISDEDEADAAEEKVSTAKILELPNELQYMIVSYLNFADLERLRRTCRFYSQLLNIDYIREHVGGGRMYAWQLTSHCQTCLETPGRHSLILQQSGGGRPPSSKCFRCSVQERDLRVGNALPLANARHAWVCRWCGWPISGAQGHSWAHEQFHINCYDSYYRVLWVFLCLGFAQFAFGVVAATLALRYYREDLLVFPPSVITFVLLWVCMAFLIFRGNRVRTYQWVGAFELVSLGLWIPPVYEVSSQLINGAVGEEKKSAIAALVFFALNMIFRLLNCIGNVVLMYEYDITRLYAPQQPLRRRLLNMLMAGLIYWTVCVIFKFFFGKRRRGTRCDQRKDRA